MSQAVTRNLAKLAALLIFIAAALYLGHVQNVAGKALKLARPTNSLPGADATAAAADLPLQEMPYHGVAIQVSYTADGVDRYIKMIDEIAELGADTVKISTAGYQEHAGSSTISLDLRKCPTRRDFARLIRHAHRRGLRVVIMPVVLLSNPRGSEWRGVIQPDSWDTWFSEYLSFIKYFAKIAAENKVEVLIIGSELISTETFTDRWEKVIAEVRKIYHGKLAYSANWDHYQVVGFWDKLDLIGMTSYYKLADEENPPLDTLLKSWKKIKADILAWQATIGKPILFTEVGWCSQPGAAIEAWNYYRCQYPTPQGLEEQANLYRAFMRTWSNEPAVAGVIWWEWTDEPGGADNYGYTPKGKPAEKLLRAWFARESNHRLARANGLRNLPQDTPPKKAN